MSLNSLANNFASDDFCIVFKQVAQLLLALTLAIIGSPAQGAESASDFHAGDNSSNFAPIWLHISGQGIINPFYNGQLLPVGHEYRMFAIPSPGYQFESWQRGDIFRLTSYIVDIQGSETITNANSSTIISPFRQFIHQPGLSVFMSVDTEQILYSAVVTNWDGSAYTNSVLSRTLGWQANFVPITQSSRHR